MRIILLIIRFFIITLFVFSAISKLYSIEPVEFYFVEKGICNLNFAPYLVRLLISVELIIAILLIFNNYRRFIILSIIVMLIVFTIFLLIEYLNQYNGNCFCFGEKFELTVGESIIKNFILIILLLIIYWHNDKIQITIPKYLYLIVIILAFIIPYIFNPIPLNLKKLDYGKAPINQLDTTLLIKNNPVYKEILSNKQIIAFFSPFCKYCKYSAIKLKLIEDKYKVLPVTIFFFGTEDDINKFWLKVKIIPFHYYLISADEFFQISGNKLPAIYFVENGQILKKFGFKNLSEDEIKQFLE